MASYDSVCGARWHISPKQRKDGGPWGDPPSRNLEVDTQAEFHLPRVVGLTCDDTPQARIRGQSGGRIRWLEVIEDVSHQGINADPHPLAHFGLFGNGKVHIPAREAANTARTTGVPIHAKHQRAELTVYGLWIAIGVQPRRVAAAPGCSTRGHAMMRRHARDGANQDGILVSRVRAAPLAERLAIAVDVHFLREATLRVEQRCQAPP